VVVVTSMEDITKDPATGEVVEVTQDMVVMDIKATMEAMVAMAINMAMVVVAVAMAKVAGIRAMKDSEVVDMAVGVATVVAIIDDESAVGLSIRQDL